ncbi:MAG: DUF92 domain-containing protein [Candidatus Asgardarchaeia archaeon]
MFSIQNLLLGILFSSILAVVAYRKKYLTVGGIITAFIIGVITMTFGGKTWFLLLVMFLFTSSAVTKYKSNAKNKVAIEKFEKGGVRDAFQVSANGLIPAIMAVIENFIPSDIFFAAFIAAVATVTADTWGTEIGILSKSPPRSVINFKRVEPGTSGGVTKIGTIAAFSGATLIGITAFSSRLLAILLSNNLAELNLIWWTIIIGAVGGFAGCFMDSLLGATVQAMYYCDVCQKETEKKIHSCGASTRHIRGFSWLNNDTVNLISALFGAIVGGLLYIILI